MRSDIQGLNAIDAAAAANHARRILNDFSGSLLTVGVNCSEFHDVLIGLLRPAAATCVSLDAGETIDLPGGDYDIVAGFDLLSAMPRSERRTAYRSLDQLARGQSLICEPLGTDLQLLILDSFRRLIGSEFEALDRQLEAMLANGLPEPAEALSWAEGLSGVDLFYAGNVSLFQSTVESRMRAAKQGRLLSYLYKKAGLDNPEGGANDLEPETVPMRRHRRLYLHRTKG